MKEQILQLCKESGFDHIGNLNVRALVLRNEVRNMCEQNRCGIYGKSWTCPPYCGTLENLRKRIQHYTDGVILQSTGYMEDEFDWECILDTQTKQKQRFQIVTESIRKLQIPFLGMSSGGCELCRKCTCPDEPCRHPDLAMISMEAYGLLVNDTCRASGIPYNYGNLTITFTSCILFNSVY